MSDIEGTGGALFLAVQFSAVLWGVTTVQCWNYARSGFKDNLYLKSTVAIVWLLNTAHQCLEIYCVWYYLVRNFSNASALHREIPAVLWQVGIVSAATFFVQSVYVWRLWILSHKNKILVFGIFFTVCANLLLGVGTTIYTIILAVSFNSHIDEGVVIASLALIVPTDLAITLSMAYFLYTSRTGFRQTDNMVQTLLVYTISTGLFPTILVVAIILCRLFSKTTEVYIALHFLLSALYESSMMFILNNRREIRAKHEYPLRKVSYPVFSSDRTEGSVHPGMPASQESAGKTTSKLEVIVERHDVVETDYRIGSQKESGLEPSDLEWSGEEHHVTRTV